MVAMKKTAFKKVALIEYPRRGIKTLAFITGEFEIKKKKHFAVFVPTTPNPTSGFFIILPKEDVVITDMSVEQAMKVIISGGMIKPYMFVILKSLTKIYKLLGFLYAC